jgi:hypothetical protein
LSKARPSLGPALQERAVGHSTTEEPRPAFPQIGALIRVKIALERRLGFSCGRNSHYAIVPFGKGARARDRSRAIKARDLNQPCHQHQGREVMATKKKKAKKKTKY